MFPNCSEAVFSFREFFLLHPLGSAIALIASGALLLTMWLKLKRWWKLLPAAVVIGLIWLAASEPVQLSMKIAAARELLAEGDWRENARFELTEAAVKIVAYKVDLRSKCNDGFLVEVENSMHIDARAFAGGYPETPDGLRLEQVASYINRSYNFCERRAEVLLGKDWRGEHPQVCADRLPRMAFFDTTRAGELGFTMKWCRELDEHVAYCEADSSGVLRATGVEF